MQQTFLGQVAQRAFEERKDNEQVQALLKLLGNKREHVIDWQITNHWHHADYATFRVVFVDGSEARGCIHFFSQYNKWYAGGNVIPAHQASRIRAQEP